MAVALRNPICSQMDQMLLKCEEVEAVLALLVTHRGVFFVHNLVTAIEAGRIDAILRPNSGLSLYGGKPLGAKPPTAGSKATRRLTSLLLCSGMTYCCGT